ncbi:MAG: hypothetical protein ABW065_02495 [Solirubrobacterales bacterium]
MASTDGEPRTARSLAALVLAALALTGLVAIVATAGAKTTESLGIHFGRTAFESVLARNDGSVVTMRGRQIESFLADGTVAPATQTSHGPAEGKLFPAAGGKTFLLGYEELTRLEPDGSVDRSFGGTGTIEPQYGAKAVSELGSGKIVVVGTETGGTHTLFSSVSVELLNQDGTVIEGAGFSSSVTPPSYEIGVPEISATSDGGALVTGSNFMLELNADGVLNRGFGDEGVVSAGFGLVGGRVLADGSVEAVGTAPAGSAGTDDLALYRYTPTGEVDTTFGPKGVRHFDLNGGEDEVTAASWGSDGSVLVGGRTRSGGSCPTEECEEVPILAAFDAAGELDPEFAEGGVLRLAPLAAEPDGYTSQGVTAMARRPDGSIIAVGNAPPNETVAFLAGVSSHGTLLPGFGEGGIVRVRDAFRASQEVVGLVPMPDGKLLAAGTTDVGIGDQPALVRYTPDGDLDRSFGAGAGWVALRSQGHSSHGATGFAVQGDRVLTGVYDYPLSHLLMARTDDGSPVSSFGSRGSIDLPREVRTAALAFAGDGDPLVLGIQRVAGPFSGEPGVVLRYHPDGRLDRDFGLGGRFTMELGGQAVRGKALLPGPGERILVAGSLGHRFAMTNLLPSGRPDPRFGSRGWSITRLRAATHYLALARIGSHIYLAGTVGEERDRQRLVLLRFESDGRLDRSFGRRGVLGAPLTLGGHPTKILPTPDGMLVVLSRGLRPLVTFGHDGEIRRRPVSDEPGIVDKVRATASRGRLILGWTTYSQDEKSEIYHLATQPLELP